VICQAITELEDLKRAVSGIVGCSHKSSCSLSFHKFQPNTAITIAYGWAPLRPIVNLCKDYASSNEFISDKNGQCRLDDNSSQRHNSWFRARNIKYIFSLMLQEWE
jgi:hypothetical protein